MCFLVESSSHRSVYTSPSSALSCPRCLLFIYSGCAMSSYPTSLTMTLVYVLSRACWSVLVTSRETRFRRPRSLTPAAKAPLLNDCPNKRYMHIILCVTTRMIKNLISVHVVRVCVCVYVCVWGGGGGGGGGRRWSNVTLITIYSVHCISFLSSVLIKKKSYFYNIKNYL